MNFRENSLQISQFYFPASHLQVGRCRIRRNFFYRDCDFGWVQTPELMNWNIPKISVALLLSLEL